MPLRRAIDAIAWAFLLVFAVLVAWKMLGRVDHARISGETTFDLRMRIWTFLALRGGVAMSTVVACGSSVATAATMTRVARPEMHRYGYREDMATGVIATLAIVVVRGQLNTDKILRALVETPRISVSNFTVPLSAMLFGYFPAITRSPQKLTAWLVGPDMCAHGTLALILIAFIIAGCILDTMAIILLLVPIVFPVVMHLGFDPIWFGVIVVMVAELGMITPPMGINVIVINTLSKGVRLTTIFRGVLPFVVTDVIRLILLIVFPALVLFLPNTM